MPILHIDPEELRMTAYKLSQMAEEIEWQMRRLETADEMLQTAWQGNSRWQFQTELNERLYRLRLLVHEIMDLSVRLHREAAKWEAIDYGF